MSHTVVKLLTNEDGDKQLPLWHFVVTTDSDRTLCSGEAFGEGEGLATYKTKEVDKGGITCMKCLNMLREFKAVQL